MEARSRDLAMPPSRGWAITCLRARIGRLYMPSNLIFPYSIFYYSFLGCCRCPRAILTVAMVVWPTGQRRMTGEHHRWPKIRVQGVTAPRMAFAPISYSYYDLKPVRGHRPVHRCLEEDTGQVLSLADGGGPTWCPIVENFDEEDAALF